MGVHHRWRGTVIATDTPQSTTAELRRSLWPRLAGSTRTWVDELAVAVDGPSAGCSGAPVEAAATLAHAIAGRAGVYGFRDEARAAARIEELLRCGDAPAPEVRAAVLDALELLRTGFAVDR